jgi:hypothetical protein
MKTFISLLFFGLFAVVSFGQDSTRARNFTVEHLQRRVVANFSEQDVVPTQFYVEEYLFTGLSVMLDGDERKVQKAWKAYLKKNNNISLRKATFKSPSSGKKITYLKAKDVSMSNISSKNGDFLTIFEKENSLTKMIVIYKLGYNISITPLMPQDYNNFHQYVQTFAVEHFQKYYKSHIKTLSKAVSTTDRALSKANSELRKMEKNYKKNFTKKSETDDSTLLVLDVQREHIETLKLEKAAHEHKLLQYKTRDQNIRQKQIKN